MISGSSVNWQQIDQTTQYREATHHYSIDVCVDWCGSDHKYLYDNHISPVITMQVCWISHRRVNKVVDQEERL